jgi:hypothetical protein
MRDAEGGRIDIQTDRLTGRLEIERQCEGRSAKRIAEDHAKGAPTDNEAPILDWLSKPVGIATFVRRKQRVSISRLHRACGKVDKVDVRYPCSDRPEDAW